MKKLLIALLTLVMVLSIGGGLVACNTDKNLDLTTGTWGPAGDNDPEDAYTVTPDGKGAMEVKYKHTSAWQGTKNMLAQFDEQELAKAKTLMFTASADKEVYIMVKFEMKKTDSPDVEIPLTLGTTEKTYRTDLSAADLSNVLRVLIFADPLNGGESQGTLNFKSLYLTAKDNTAGVTELHADINVGGTPNVITANNTKVINWFDGKNGKVYDVSSQNEVNTIKYTKVFDTSYFPLQATVSGDLSAFKTFRITLKGAAGQRILVKPFNNNAFEKMVDLDGTEQEEIIDLTKAEVDANQNLMLFAAPGSDEGTGTFQILHAEFSTEAAPVVGPIENENLNTITATDKKISKWYAEDAYTINVEQGNVTATIGRNDGWAQLKADVTGTAISGMTHLKVTLTGVNGVPFVLKDWNNTEYDYDGRSATQAVPTTNEVTVMMAVPSGDYSATKALIIFVNVGDSKVDNCTVTVSAEFVVQHPVNTITTDNAKVTQWYDASGEGKFTTTVNQDGTVTVVKKANQSFSMLSADVTGADLATLKSVKITLRGVQGVPFILKDYNGKEHKVENANVPTTDEYTATFDMEAGDKTYTDTLTIGIMINWDAAVDYTFTIVEVEFVATQVQP